MDKRHVPTFVLAALAGVALAACNSDTTNGVVTAPNHFTETRLVADVAGLGPRTVDTNLVNAWGIAFSTSGLLWVANNGTGTSTIYDTTGARRSLVVSIPTSTSASGGVPTGIALNTTTDFMVGTTPASFIFAGEDGTISAWNSGTGTQAVLEADESLSLSVYKGIAIAANGGANFLFATNFRLDRIDVFDASYHFVRSFTDANIPAGFAPFGIHAMGGQLWVTYAKQMPPENHDDQAGVGNGFVDVFNADGTLSRRFASNGSLNSPWGVAVAPAGFGPFAGDILVGNFGDGLIGAYDPTSGAFVDFVRDANGAVLSIDGLWGLTFGPGSMANTLFFSSGPSSESHGLVGTLTQH